MTLEWMILALVAAGVVATAALILERDRRHPAGTPAAGRHPLQAQPADPLHRHATHYFASGALPRWDP